MKHSFIKHALIAGATVFTMAWVAVFAQTNVQTNILNAVQTIMRTVYTTNGSSNGSRLMDINDGTGIYISGVILQSTTAVNGLGIDANGYLTTNVALGWWQPWPQWPAGPQGPQGATGYSVVASGDADWFIANTPNIVPMSIFDDIYTYGQVWIGLVNPTVPLQVSGSVIFGMVGNSISNIAPYSSILGWSSNYIQWFWPDSTIVWGTNNIASWWSTSSIVGWQQNRLSNTLNSIIGGGNWNQIIDDQESLIGWWQNNAISGSVNSVVVWWSNNQLIQWQFAWIGWGSSNIINTISGPFTRTLSSNIVWGDLNTITESHYSLIWGWIQNEIIWGIHASGHNLASQNIILIWENNKIEYSILSSILWWRNNLIKWYTDTEWNNLWPQMQLTMNLPSNGNPLFQNNNIIWEENHIRGSYGSYIIWGLNTSTWSRNTLIWESNSTIGSHNRIFGDFINMEWMHNYAIGLSQSIQGNSNVSIGRQNTLSGWNNYNFWSNNTMDWNYLMTLGFNANAIGFWIGIINVDWVNPITASQNGSFIINAPSGVGINHTAPLEALDVNGNIKTQRTFVAPSGNQGIAWSLNPPIVLNLMGWDGNPCTMTIEAGIVVATDCPIVGQVQQPLLMVVKGSNPWKNLSTSALRFSITNNSQNTSSITNLYFDTLLQGYQWPATLEVLRNNVVMGSVTINPWYDTQTIVPINYQQIDAQDMATFVVRVINSIVDPNAPSQYREISLSGVDFDNVWWGQVSANYPITETQ